MCKEIGLTKYNYNMLNVFQRVLFCFRAKLANLFVNQGVLSLSPGASWTYPSYADIAQKLLKNSSSGFSLGAGSSGHVIKLVSLSYKYSMSEKKKIHYYLVWLIRVTNGDYSKIESLFKILRFVIWRLI